MTKEYSAHPDLACEQLQKAELEAKLSNTAATKNTCSSSSAPHIYHRRQHSNNNNSSSNSSLKNKQQQQQNSAKDTTTTTKCCAEALDLCSKLPNRTNAEDVEDAADKLEINDKTTCSTMAYTKDCVDIDYCCSSLSATNNNSNSLSSYSLPPFTHENDQCRLTNTTNENTENPTMPDIDETDHVQNRFSRNCSSSSRNDDTNNLPSAASPALMVDGCVSGLSSAFSSPSASTMSSPLCTPTRLAPQLQHSHQHCCHKLGNSTHTHSHPHQQLHHHHHHHHHLHHHANNDGSAAKMTTFNSKTGCKKIDPRLGPSPYRQLLPIALCILSFATVFSILIVYMDTTGE